MTRMFLSEDGRLQRLNNHGRISPVQSICTRKLLAMGIVLAIMYITNPACNLLPQRFYFHSSKQNVVPFLHHRKSKNPQRSFLGSISSKWFDVEIDIFQVKVKKTQNKEKLSFYSDNFSSSLTNYIIFSLDPNDRGVQIMMTATSFQFCDFDGLAPSACYWIGKAIACRNELLLFPVLGGLKRLTPCP